MVEYESRACLHSCCKGNYSCPSLEELHSSFVLFCFLQMQAFIYKMHSLHPQSNNEVTHVKPERSSSFLNVYGARGTEFAPAP